MYAVWSTKNYYKIYTHNYVEVNYKLLVRSRELNFLPPPVEASDMESALNQ